MSPFAGDADVPTRRELLDRYADRSDRDLTNVNYYCVLGLFKLACVMEGSFARFRAGTSDDAYFASLEHGVPRWRAARSSSRPATCTDRSIR